MGLIEVEAAIPRKHHQENGAESVWRHFNREITGLHHAAGAGEYRVIIPCVVETRDVFDDNRRPLACYLRAAILVTVEQSNVDITTKRLASAINDLKNDFACVCHGEENTKLQGPDQQVWLLEGFLFFRGLDNH
jgi:hypothetical protein